MTTTTTGPTLETGWRPDTPADDTMLRQFVLNLSSSWAAAADSRQGRVRRDDRFVAADMGGPSGMFNSTTLVQPLHGDDLEEALDEIDSFYAEEGSGSFLLWSPWRTPDLRRRGWELEGHPPMLLRPAGVAIDVDAPDELDIVEVHDGQGIEDWCALAVDAFPLEDLQPYRPGALLDERILADDRYRFLVGYVDGEPVCIGSRYVAHGLNTLFLAATDPATRGHGYYRAMAARRVADRPDLPDAAVVSDMSRPVLVDRLGFLPVTRFALWARQRP